MRTIQNIFLGLFMLTAVFSSQAQTSRRNINFNKEWSFIKTKDSLNTKWEAVALPHTWNAKDMQLSKDFYEGEGIYKKEEFFGEEYKNKRLFLRFEGAGQVASLYVNDKFVGTHKGSYSAFVFDISYAIKIGEKNKIVVKVNNTARKDIIPINHFLFGIYGGIYRPVNLIVTDKINITTTDYASPGIYISQKDVSKNSADVSVAIKVENVSPKAENMVVKTSVFDQKGGVVIQKEQSVLVSTQGRQEYHQDLQIKNPTLWDGFNNPYLYKIVVQLFKENQIIDEVVQPLGLRKFELIAGKGMFLNDKPYAMQGVSRHQDRWEYGNALSNAQHKEDLDIIKEMGATTIRFAHYQQAEYLYSQCDSMGFVIWAEIPFVNTFSGEEAENTKQQMTELIKQNFNHPSIYVWGLHNEVYGKTAGDFVPVLTRDLNDIAKILDPSRYTASVSGYGEMTRPANLNADIQGMNRYYGWYEGKIGQLENWASGLEKEFPDNKVILAEYGADGNVFQQQEQADLSDKFDYTSPFYPETYETKTHEIQWPIIKKHPYILASYVWNMFDFATPMWNRGSLNARNMKGLVTFDRKLKKDAFYWYKANWSKEPVLYLTERRAVERKHAQTYIKVYSNIGTPEVFLNGKKLPLPTNEEVLYTFNSVLLKKGSNIIKTKIVKNGKTYQDEIKWILK